MTRPTVLAQPAGKVFNAEDRPLRHKSVTHLVTEANFLSNDHDFSQIRPFQMSKTPQRKVLPSPLYHLDRTQPSDQVERASSRRAYPQTSHKFSSSIDLSWSSTPPLAPKPQSKQVSSMLQGRLLLRDDLPVPVRQVPLSKQERVGQYMNSHLMKSSLRHRERSEKT